jgi:hypothetical protein
MGCCLGWPSREAGAGWAGSAGPRAQELSQLLAYLAHRNARPVGDGTYNGNRCEQCVLPEIVSLPPDDLIEQVGLGSPAQCRHRQDSEPQLVLLPATQRALGQKPLPYPRQGDRIGPADPGPAERISAQARKTSPGKVSLRGCNGASSLTSSKMPASRASPSRRIPRAVTASWGAGRFLAGIPRPQGTTLPGRFLAAAAARPGRRAETRPGPAGSRRRAQPGEPAPWLPGSIHPGD